MMLRISGGTRAENMFVDVFVVLDSQNGGVSKRPGTTGSEHSYDTSPSLEKESGDGFSVLIQLLPR